MKSKKIIDFTVINNNYVCHFLTFINDKDRELAEKIKGNDIFGITTLYKIALKKAHILGGRKYHNKRYGGGIAFYTGGDIDDLQNRIITLINS